MSRPSVFPPHIGQQAGWSLLGIAWAAVAACWAGVAHADPRLTIGSAELRSADDELVVTGRGSPGQGITVSDADTSSLIGFTRSRTSRWRVVAAVPATIAGSAPSSPTADRSSRPS
jgi:hypothetical protein